jgi:GH24 family phage-related lysozyme (muramidase)
MLLSTHQLADDVTLSDELFKFIKARESMFLTPYIDGTSASIGYGAYFPSYSDIVFDEMGITNPEDRQAYMSIMNNSRNNSNWRADLDNEYRLRTGNNSVVFKLASEQQARNIFDAIILDKQTRLHPLLGINTDNPLIELNSYEYIAIMSMYYNGERTVGSGLLNALRNNNRAEAWYEIRYNSNSDGQNARRRIIESNLFGLYDTTLDNISADEAKTIIRMSIIHEHTTPNRRGITEEEVAFPNEFANGKDISSQIQSVKNYLVKLFVTDEEINITIDGNVIVGAGLDSYSYKEGTSINDNITVGEGDTARADQSTNDNDLIFGEKGNDEIHGGKGNDVIYGGKGDDILYGEDGSDKLYAGAGDDKLYGGKGSDSYYIANLTKYDGDCLKLSSTSSNATTNVNLISDEEGIDTIVFTGYSTDDIVSIVTYKEGENKDKLIITLGKEESNRSVVTVDKQYIIGNRIEFFRFDNANIDAHGIVKYMGTDEDDYIRGTEGNNTLKGGKGDDRLEGGKGDDVYYIEAHRQTHILADPAVISGMHR